MSVFYAVSCFLTFVCASIDDMASKRKKSKESISLYLFLRRGESMLILFERMHNNGFTKYCSPLS